MPWLHIISMYKRAFHKQEMNCEKYYVRRFVQDAIVKEFPGQNREKVQKAIEYCCERPNAPKEIEKYFAFLAEYLKIPAPDLIDNDSNSSQIANGESLK